MNNPPAPSRRRSHSPLLFAGIIALLVWLVAVLVAPADAADGVFSGGSFTWPVLGVLAVLAAGWLARSLIRARAAAKRLAAGIRRRLIQSGERFRALVEDGSYGTLICDKDSTIAYASPALQQLLGYPPAQLTGKTLDALLHPEDRVQWQAAMAYVGNSALPVLHRMGHADGSWRWIETRLRDLSAVPAVGGMVLNCLDVSAREHALREQRAAEQQLLIALDTSEVVLWDLHLASGAVRLSPQWAQCSTASMQRLSRSRRLASCASIATSTRSWPKPSVARLMFTPTPIALSSRKTASASVSTGAVLGATRSSTIPGITCRF